MLKPSKHYVVYDAVTYKEVGFLVKNGKIGTLSQKPRYWKVNVTVTSEDDKNRNVDSFSFTSQERMLLSELGTLVNQEIHKRTYLDHCVKCMVKASILTEGGK